MRFRSLLTVADTQVYDLKIALANQLFPTNIQLLLHLPELLLKLGVVIASSSCAIFANFYLSFNSILFAFSLAF